MTFLQSKVIKLITKRILNESFIIFFFFSRKYSTFIENVDFISYPVFSAFLFHFNLTPYSAFRAVYAFIHEKEYSCISTIVIRDGNRGKR